MWTSWGEPLANFTEAVNEVFLMACAMQMTACRHTYTVSAHTHKAPPPSEKHTLAFTHTSLVSAHEGRGRAAQLLKQPKALAGTVQQLCCGPVWFDVGVALFLGALLAICSALGFPRGNTGYVIDTKHLSYCSAADEIHTVFKLIRRRLDVRFCWVDYMLRNNPWPELLLDIVKKNLCQMINELPCAALSDVVSHTFYPFIQRTSR